MSRFDLSSLSPWDDVQDFY
uniref:Uncharacterized protein n=1 Tax=Anguilla anguilla TaxID=7936 RepID=A0A0E9R2U5_ANGAN